MPRQKPKMNIDWSSAPQAARKRKKVQVTLSDEAREKLERLRASHPDGTSSAVIEDLIMEARA